MTSYDFIERGAVANAFRAEAKHQAGLSATVGVGSQLHVIHGQLHAAFSRMADKIDNSIEDSTPEY